MKFNKKSKERLELGVKRLTSRSTSHASDPNVDYVVGPLPFKFIRDFLWKDEGALCPKEMQRWMNQVQRRKVPDGKMLFVHVLKEVSK